jgi:hypothetical protein
MSVNHSTKKFDVIVRDRPIFDIEILNDVSRLCSVTVFRLIVADPDHNRLQEMVLAMNLRSVSKVQS